MEFTNSTLAGLMATTPSESEVAAERANLCMEERVSAARQTAYEDRVGAPDGWEDWRDNHLRYVQEEVRRRHLLSAALTGGEPSLRPGIEPNQYLYRVERIDALFNTYATTIGESVGVEQVKEWISARNADQPAEKVATSLTDLSRLMLGDTPSPKVAALQELTDIFNEKRKDGRPCFVAFGAEFPRLEGRADWARHICEHCGLAHFFADIPVTLALFRYKVQEVLDARLKCREQRNCVRRTHRDRPAHVQRVFHSPEGHGFGARGRLGAGSGLSPSRRRADPCEDGLSVGALGCGGYAGEEQPVRG